LGASAFEESESSVAFFSMEFSTLGRGTLEISFFSGAGDVENGWGCPVGSTGDGSLFA